LRILQIASGPCDVIAVLSDHNLYHWGASDPTPSPCLSYCGFFFFCFVFFWKMKFG
jgi:hypothetical protein